jgi:FkbM family methyltransferase
MGVRGETLGRQDRLSLDLINWPGRAKVALQRAVRYCLDRLGYVLWKREFLQYGILPFLDISRLSKAWGSTVTIIFDVGANIGQTSRQARDAFPDARIHAFEPHPETFGKLKISAAQDRFLAYQLALGEKDGEATFYEYASSGEGSLINSLTPNARFPLQYGHSATGCISVTCSTIDSFCAEHKIDHVDLLKIDTEGFDLNVLRGAERMLRQRAIKFVYVEFNDLEPREGAAGGSLMPISAYLSQFEFRYITSYTDFVLTGDPVFVCANALFALPPGQPS